MCWQDVEGRDHGLVLRYYFSIYLEGIRKSFTILCWISGFWTRICMQDLLNTKQECYSLPHIFCFCVCCVIKCRCLTSLTYMVFHFCRMCSLQCVPSKVQMLYVCVLYLEKPCMFISTLFLLC